MSPSDPPDPRLVQLANLGTQMAVMVHELRQPLFALKALLALEQVGGTGLDGRVYEQVSEQIHQIERLISQYGDIGKVGTPAEPFDLNVPVRQTADWMRLRAPQYGVRFHTELAPCPLPVLACPNGAQQLTYNLIQNAYEAVLQGPGQGEVTLRTSQRGDWVRLEVEDTGGGMSEDQLVRVMEPFVTTKSKLGGTGLGLYVVQSIVDASDGRFRWVSSEKGLCAEVELPIRR
jgi:signal transduction histidine kinase